ERVAFTGRRSRHRRERAKRNYSGGVLVLAGRAKRKGGRFTGNRFLAPGPWGSFFLFLALAGFLGIRSSRFSTLFPTVALPWEPLSQPFSSSTAGDRCRRPLWDLPPACWLAQPLEFSTPNLASMPCFRAFSS